MINELSKAGDTKNQIGRLVLGAAAQPWEEAMNPTVVARYDAHHSGPYTLMGWSV